MQDDRHISETLFFDANDKYIRFRVFNIWYASVVAFFPIIGSILSFNYINFMAYIICGLCVYAPYAMEKYFHVFIFEEFHFITTFQVMLHGILGKYFGFYDKYPLFDSYLHVLGGAWLAFLAIPIFYSIELNYSNHKVRTTKIKVNISTFNFVNSVGVLWEISEFISDIMFDGTPGYRLAQENSLFDTMTDLVENNIGSIIAIFIFWKVIESTRMKYRNINDLIKRVVIPIDSGK